MSFVYSQTPIIRLMQSREYKTPKYWWRDQETFKLRGYLADDTTGMSTANATSGVAYMNNNFDAWRDSVMTIAVTLDDKGASVTAFRLDIIFDNDLFKMANSAGTGDSTRVEKGAYIAGWTEGDEDSTGTDYSYEVVRYANVGYIDSLQTAGSEKSAANNRYDWLRITMVSHDGTTHTFGNGNNVQTELLKLHFRVGDVNDNFQPQSFRVATKYEGSTGYYTYVTNGNYLTTYKVYIDGNWGDATVAHRTYNGGARGDITLHPKLVDIEGYFRYVQGNSRGRGAAFSTALENTYPYWKIKFELDQKWGTDNGSNWYNIETVSQVSSLTDEDNSDDVIGDHTSTFYYDKKSTTAAQVLPKEGFLGISYYDSTYTDDKGFYSIQLPRNNHYRMSFWPPDASDDIETHNQSELDRKSITNVADAVASFNFQSNKFHSISNAGGVDTLNAIEYFIGDVDGDDFFHLNDTYILWAYVSGIFTDYTHHNGNTYEDWSTIDTLHASGNPQAYGYYQTINGQSRPQRYEFTVFEDGDFNQAQALTFGQIEVINPLMDDIKTGLDTMHYAVGAGTSTWPVNNQTNLISAARPQDVNPDYTIDSLSYFFTGDINTTGTKVGSNAYQTLNGSTFYRWGNSAPSEWTAKINTGNLSPRTLGKSMIDSDVHLSLPADSTVRVSSGDQIEIPLTITPKDGIYIAGFEFEVEYKVDELEFVDMKTDILPGPWMTYVNVHEPENGWQRVSFGGMDYSPNNAPKQYWIDKEIVGLKLIFRADFPDAEWTEAPVRFVGKHAAGNPSGHDLNMSRDDGMIMVWNKYWAFGGGEPENDEITYNYPNPFTENTKFQFFIDETEKVKLYILNSMGQYVGTLLNEEVGPGIHQFDFTNEPTAWLPEVSLYENHKKLEPGVYVFVLETEKKIKANKFTVIK
tara:strand:+ start:159 stop:2909 length:2751 start_codon:yes stop_codon:yes gene_type:complete